MKTIGRNELVRMIKAAAELIHANEPLLSKLDSATGDGDHGTTIGKVMDAAVAAAQAEPGSIAEVLNKVGWDVMCVDGGSAPPLLGSFFTGMSEGVAGKEQLDTAALAVVLEAGVKGMREHSKAQVGDKTMMDALLPAVDAVKAGAGKDVSAALREAAEAAKRGALATKDMAARFGRARNLGDRTKGHQDPGATSVAFIFQGFADAVK
jgi:dihydroxyacetone kinase-like protein